MEPENQTPASPVSAEQKKGGVGALIGSIIIILILVLGALYFWGGKLENKDGEINFDESSATANNATQTSDEVSDIDADFNNQETLNLDDDLNAVNQAQ